MSVRISTETPWYELFSRGARDWLRHNQKVRAAVKERLPELLTSEDLISRPGSRTVLVPVRLLEHARLRLLEPGVQRGAGQGRGEPGEVLRPGRAQGEAQAKAAGTEEGELRFVLELKTDEIVDWLWDELKLPELKPRPGGSLEEPDYVREGWDKRGARSRLDRRRTVKEAVKRRAMQEEPLEFTSDDLRYRQLVRRARPAVNAAVILALDVSGSMEEAQRRLAKLFFFFALEGIRRQYARVETVFLAHAASAWEFDEAQFFQASGTGGTLASSAFRLALETIDKRFNPERYNVYFFYASDGENSGEDRGAAADALGELAESLNYAGYIEVGGGFRPRETQIGELFAELKAKGSAVGASRLASQDDVWQAIREFFSEEAAEAPAS